MNGPDRFVRHLAEEGYHPRSDAHSNALCEAVLGDLLETCDPLADRAMRGELVAQLNHTIQVGYRRWNIDLALGPPPGGEQDGVERGEIRREVPATIQVALELKGVMTEHQKARKNRLRDLHAFHEHAHTYDGRTIAAGVVAVNVSPVFWSPLRDEHDITYHENIERIGRETVELYRNLPLRERSDGGGGVEAACVLVVEHDNLNRHPDLPRAAPAPSPTRLVEKSPAPQRGDPLNYGTFIHRICDAYRERWT